MRPTSFPRCDDSDRGRSGLARNSVWVAPLPSTIGRSNSCATDLPAMDQLEARTKSNPGWRGQVWLQASLKAPGVVPAAEWNSLAGIAFQLPKPTRLRLR